MIASILLKRMANFLLKYAPERRLREVKTLLPGSAEDTVTSGLQGNVLAQYLKSNIAFEKGSNLQLKRNACTFRL